MGKTFKNLKKEENIYVSYDDGSFKLLVKEKEINLTYGDDISILVYKCYVARVVGDNIFTDGENITFYNEDLLNRESFFIGSALYSTKKEPVLQRTLDIFKKKENKLKKQIEEINVLKSIL